MLALVLTLLKSISTPNRHFLVVLQNNNELRATGGFITKVIDISFFSIRFRRVFDELDQHKPVKGPKPLMRMLDDGYLKSWSLRDANYAPDFKESADQISKFYSLVFPTHRVEKVLAINFSFIEKYFEILGSIHIKKKKISSADLFYFLSAEVSDIDRHNKKVLAERKNILRSLGKNILTASLLRFWKWPRLLLCIQRSFSNKDLQMNQEGYYTPFSFEKNTDFLAVIDSNFLGYKSNRYIKRSVMHQSNVEKTGELEQHVQVLFEHFGKEDYPLSGTYRSYCRIYIPAAARKIEIVGYPALGNKKIQKNGTSTEIGFELYLPSQGKLVVTLLYRMPILKENYEFKYFKQSGVKRENFQKTLALPKSKRISQSKSGVVSEYVFTEDIAQIENDYSIKLNIKNSQESPRILFHEIVDPKKVFIRFSEPMILPKSARGKIEIREKKTKKKISISKIESRENDSSFVLHVPDMPEDEEVFYIVSLKNLKSKNGNAFKKKERRVTVVYRPRFFW
jgi:hypothetical protein